jgi:hypothetical protein
LPRYLSIRTAELYSAGSAAAPDSPTTVYMPPARVIQPKPMKDLRTMQ